MNRGKVLVTGAAGFVGKHLVKLLIEKGYQIKAMVRHNTDISDLKALDIEIIEADLRIKETLSSALDGVDYVVHLATAMKGPWDEYLESTIKGTEGLLEIAKEKQMKRFIYISSIGVLDVGGKDILKEDSSYVQESATYYEKSKREAEKTVLQFSKEGIPCVIIRPGIIYGPGGTLYPSRLGYEMGENRFLVIGNGNNRLPFVYVRNLIDAICLALENSNAPGQIYNIVDEQEITQNYYLENMKKIINPSLRIIRIPYSVALGMSGLLGLALKMVKKASPFRKSYMFQCSHQINYSNEKIKKELGWSSGVRPQEAVIRIMEAYRDEMISPRDVNLKRIKGIVDFGKPLRVGIAGCGVISSTHLDILKKIKNLNVAAFCDVDKKIAQETAKRFGGGTAYDDFDEMLNKEKLDVVHILTPPQLHKEMAVKAAQKGCHILLEKPMAMNAAEAREIVNAAEKNNIKLCVGHNHVYDPIMIEARRLINKGLLGDIVSVESWYGFNLGKNLNNRYMMPGAEKHWTMGLPGKLYQNLLPHPLSVLADIIGYPDQLTAYTTGGKVVKTMPHDELRVLAKCGKKIGFISVSLSVSPRYQIMNIYGTKMSLNLDFLNKALIRHSVSKVLPGAFSRALINLSIAEVLMGSTFRNVWKTLTKTFTPYDGTEILIKEFYRSITEEKTVPISAEDGFKGMEAMDKIWSQIKF